MSILKVLSQHAHHMPNGGPYCMWYVQLQQCHSTFTHCSPFSCPSSGFQGHEVGQPMHAAQDVRHPESPHHQLCRACRVSPKGPHVQGGQLNTVYEQHLVAGVFRHQPYGSPACKSVDCSTWNEKPHIMCAPSTACPQQHRHLSSRATAGSPAGLLNNEAPASSADHPPAVIVGPQPANLTDGCTRGSVWNGS